MTNKQGNGGGVTVTESQTRGPDKDIGGQSREDQVWRQPPVNFRSPHRIVWVL